MKPGNTGRGKGEKSEESISYWQMSGTEPNSIVAEDSVLARGMLDKL